MTRLQDLSELRSVLDEATVAFEETVHQIPWLFANTDEWVRHEDNQAVKAGLERMAQEGSTRTCSA